jgi:hypothetical protein
VVKGWASREETMKNTPESLNNSKKPTEPDKKETEGAQEGPKKPRRFVIVTVPIYKPSHKHVIS